MKISNDTVFSVEHLLQSALRDYPHDDLDVEIKYSPRGTERSVSGTYYLRTPKRPNGRLIRIRINRFNKYPVVVPFKTSEYYTKLDIKGREVVYQKFRKESFSTPEHLILAIFLHEFSHYLDHMQGLNGRYKQTKADKFSTAHLEKLGVVK